jgi:TM2 domain-containing membrane protein YozV/Tfp pilus assembly major pilin PilA
MVMSMIFCRGCGKEIHESAVTCPHCGAPQVAAAAAPAKKLKSQTVAALLSAFLGGLGIHRFYLGPIWVGVVYLLFCWTGIPGLIAFVETFIIVFSSQETWAKKYNDGTITPPAHIAVKILVLIFPAVVIIGIIAAIALPAYQDYTSKSKVASVVLSLTGPKVQLAEHLLATNGAPLSEANLSEIQKAVSDNKEIRNVDAFAFRNYADVGARINVGGQDGAIFLVTLNQGQSWQCIGVGLQAKYLPKSCELGDVPQRPTIPKPSPKIGLWDKPFFDSAMNDCVQRALSRGDANGQASCSCVLMKLATAVPQDAVQTNTPTPEVSAIIQAAGSECQSDQQ